MALRKGIKNFPKGGDLSDLGELFSQLGDMLDDQGDAIGAEKVFREGTRRAPGNVFCITSMADKLVQQIHQAAILSPSQTLSWLRHWLTCRSWRVPA